MSNVRSSSKRRYARILACAVVTALPLTASAYPLTWHFGNLDVWDAYPDRKAVAITNFNKVVARYNAYADFTVNNDGTLWGGGDINVNQDPTFSGTADASPGGTITFHSYYANEDTVLHESNHWFGSVYGQSLLGPHVTAIIQQFEGLGTFLAGSGGTHFGAPYGMNYPDEYSEIVAQRNIALMYAMRRDWGYGNQADPTAWAATNVTLSRSDAVGESGFNYGDEWSDHTFAHYNADYSTGAFDLRTPQGTHWFDDIVSTRSWKFVGKSLTINSGGRLLYGGAANTITNTIDNLTLAGGTVRNDQGSGLLFQLAGSNMQLASGTTNTFDANNGNITVLSPLNGAGALTKIGGNTLTLTAANTFTGPIAVNAGTLSIGPGGSLAGNAITVNGSGATFGATGNATVGTSGSPTITLAANNGGLSTVGGGKNTLTINSATAGATVLTLGGSNTIKMDSTAAGVDSIVLGATLKANAGLANTIALNLVDRPTATRTSTLIDAPGGFAGNGNFTLSVSGASTFGMTLGLDSSDPTQLKLVETITPAPNTAYFVGGKGSAKSWVGNSLGQGNFSSDSAGTTLLNTLPAYNTDVVFKASNASSTNVAATTLDSPLTIKSLTFAGANTGGFGVAAGNNGVLTLQPASSSSGLTVSSGASPVTLSVPIVLGADQTWTNNSSNTLNVSSVISGSGNFTKVGTGAMTLSGASTFSGTFTNAAGTTTFNQPSTFTGNVVVNGGTLLVTWGENSSGKNGRTYSALGSAQTVGKTVTINNGGTVSFTVGNVLGSGSAGSAPNLSFVINQGGLLKTTAPDLGGGGGGDCNLFGNITLNGGTFTTGNGYNAAYPAAVFLGTITTGGTAPSTINTNASNTTANGISVSGGTSAVTSSDDTGTTVTYSGTTFNVGATGGSGADLTVSVPLYTGPGGGGGSITKIGAGQMLLTANNTFTGSTNVNGGTLILDGANARLVSTPTIANGVGSTATMTISGGAIVTSPGEVAISNQGGTGTLSVLTGSSLTGTTVTVGRGIGATNAANATFNVLGGTVTTTDGNSPFATGSYGNATNVAVTNVGYGSDGTTRGTITSAGEIDVGNESATGTMNLNAGASVTGNNWLIIGRRAGNGTLNIANDASIAKATTTGQAWIGFSYQSNGATGVVNQNGGSFTSAVPLQMAFDGGDRGTYNLNGGVLSVPQVVRGNGSATVNFNGGTLQAAAGANATAFLKVNAANVRNGGAIIDTNGQDVTLTQSLRHSTIAGDAAVDGGLTKVGNGTLTLATKNTFTGNVTVNGGTLRLNNSAATPATPIASYNFNNVNGNTVVNAGSGGAAMNGTLNANGGTGSINLTAGPGAGMGALVLNGNGTTVDINSSVTDLSGNGNWTVSAWVKTTQQGATIFNKGNGTGWANGYSTFYLDDTNRGVPNAVRYAGGWMGGSTAVNDGTWHLVTYTDAGGTKAVYVDGVLDNLNRGDFNNADTGTKIRIGFAPNGGDGAATTNGSLSGLNFYNTALTADQILAMYARTVTGIPSTAGVSIASGATFDVNGVTQQVASLNAPAGAAVLLGSGQLIINGATTSSYLGSIAGTGGAIVKQGAGTLTLGGANTYTGGTMVTGGTLTVTASNALGNGPVAITGGTVALQGTLPAPVVVPSLSVGAGGKVDLNSSGLVIDYPSTDTTSAAAAAADVLAGRITSSKLAGNANLAIGYASSAELGGTFQGVALDGSAIALLATLKGDTSLDETVNFTDLLALAKHYGTTAGATWAQGDNNYDGAVNFTDLLALAKNYGQTLPAGVDGASPQFAADFALAQTLAPEPATLGTMLALIVAGSRRRRSR